MTEVLTQAVTCKVQMRVSSDHYVTVVQLLRTLDDDGMLSYEVSTFCPSLDLEKKVSLPMDARLDYHCDEELIGMMKNIRYMVNNPPVTMN